jgi:8-amino-7-oxononanoate synthase
MRYLDQARAVLADIETKGLRRTVKTRGDDAVIADFASNDYLGLSRSPAVVEAMRSARIVGAGGSRLLSGAHPDHAALEEEIAHLVRRKRALLFSSGYLAGIGAIHAASRLVTHAYSDADNHASIIDALRLTHLTRHVFPHLRPPPQEDRNAPALLVSESLFGMSGCRANIPALLECLGDDDILILDEAHALGVCGERGSGCASAYDDERIVIIGTLSKAFGCVGGFIAGHGDFIDLTINTARTFMFDTAMPPAIARAARAALHAIEQGNALRARLDTNKERIFAGLRRIDPSWNVSNAAIVPLMLGDAQRALTASAFLLARQIDAPAIRPPTVPSGSSRLRITLRADHTEAEIASLLRALEDMPLHPLLSSAAIA